MSKYKEIKGFKVQTLATDTAASVASTGSWAAGASMNTARDYVGGAATSSDSALIFGGATYRVEQYDGSSWTEKTEMNISPTAGNYARAPMGTATACIAAGGSASYLDQVEQWDGSSWTEIAELNTGRAFGSASPIGTVTAGLVVGGLYANPGQATANSELWNGSAWTETNNLNTARSYDAGLGTSTSALVANGQAVAPGYVVSNTVETWDGSSWTEVAEINTARGRGVAAGINSTAAIYYAGSTGPSTVKAQTESWDGSSWTEVADLATARQRGGGGGTISSAIIAGGNANPPVTGATEEWTTTPAANFTKINLGQVYYNSTSNAFKVTKQSTPAGTWASGGNLNVAKGSAAGAGTQTTGIFMGGRGSPPSPTVYAQTELYNGSTWTEVNDMNTGRYALSGANSGSQTATLVFAGYDTAILALTESWNGSSWTEVNDLNTAGTSGAGFGTQPAAIFTGGDNRSYNKTESWDGTSWTETTDLNTARAQMAGFGLATAGLICGGDLYPVTSPTRLSVQTELWNGSAWTEVNDLNTGRRRIGNGGFGTQTSGLTAGGYTTTYVANTESWNGTSWTEQTEIQTRDDTTGIGSGANSGLIAGGGTSPGAMSNATEEWTVPEANKTITVS